MKFSIEENIEKKKINIKKYIIFINRNYSRTHLLLRKTKLFALLLGRKGVYNIYTFIYSKK